MEVISDWWLVVSRAPTLRCGPIEEKRPIVNNHEPRMDTNKHEDRWTYSNDKRHPSASAILFPEFFMMPFIDYPLDIGSHTPRINNSLIRLLVSIHGSSFSFVDNSCRSFVPFVDVVAG